MDAKQLHSLLVSYIHKRGKSFPKRHGNWIKLDLFKDYYLSLDSWNRGILFNRGNGNYNEWTGFGDDGKDYTIAFLGGDFGGFSKPDREETLNWIVKDVLKL